MACLTELKTINEHEYSVTQWAVNRALLTKFKLIKMFGASFGAIAGALDDKDDDAKQAEAIAKGLKVLFDSSTPDELVNIITNSIIGVARDGKKMTESDFIEHFSGDALMDIYPLFIFILKVNYSNLFKGQLVGGLLTKLTDSQ